VFIGGSRDVSRLDAAVKGRLLRIVEKRLPVVIGDASGADKAVQRYFGGRNLRLQVPGAVGGPSPGRMGPETVMTKALEDAFKEAQKLPEVEQDQLAAAIRAEIEAERDWDKRLAGSGNALATLSDEALVEHRSGRTLPLDPDEQ